MANHKFNDQNEPNMFIVYKIINQLMCRQSGHGVGISGPKKNLTFF